MPESVSQILKESVSKKKKHLKYLVPLLLLGTAAGGYFWYNSQTEAETVYIPKIYEVVQGSISSTVSSDGNIINPDIVNLSFLINGTLENLYVEEGDKVEAGQLLAELDKRDLNFDLQSAQNDVNISWQNIKAKEADITDTDIINAQSDFEITQSQIENDKINAEQDFSVAKKNANAKIESAEQSLEQTFDRAKITLSSAFSDLDSSLQEINYLFGIDRDYTNQTIPEKVFANSIGVNNIKNGFNDLNRELEILRNDYDENKSTIERAHLSQLILKVQEFSGEANNLYDIVISVFDNATDSASTSQSTISNALSKMQSYQSKVQGIESSLSNTKQSIDTDYLNLQNTRTSINNDIEDARLSMNNTITNIENNLKNAELKVDNAEKSVNKSNISKQTSLSIQYAQLAQSKLKVEKAQYNVDLASLTAPKDGTIIRINGSVGESLKADSIDAETAFIRIVSDANFTTEVYVEEIDIAQITTGQKANITLDAIPDVTLEGEVSYISNMAEIDNNGIVTYLVEIDIIDNKEAPIREGMTTYIDFVLGEANDVIIVPNSAIIRGKFVMLENSEQKAIETGFTDGDFTEIKSGLSIGDKVISNPQTDNTNSVKGSGNSERKAVGNLSEERITEMKAAGFSDEEITKIQAGEFTDEMRAKMQKMREATSETSGGSILGGSTTRGAGGGRPR